MAQETKKTLNVICENCDSEFTIKYAKSTVSGEPECCCFCGEEIRDNEEIDDEDEAHNYRSDDEEG